MNTKQHAYLLCFGLVLAVLPGYGADAAGQSRTVASPVVMVCEHGTVKSVIAAVLFNREAKARGLSVRAISRGISLDEKIPSKISEALESDGFDVSEFAPQKLSGRDVSSSSRVIAIGTDLSAIRDDAAATFLLWDDIPPASVDYEASKASLLSHIHVLLGELEMQK